MLDANEQMGGRRAHNRKSVAPETALEEGAIDSETIGTLKGCIASLGPHAYDEGRVVERM